MRCSRRRILDAALHVRPGSATFGRHVAVELTAANWLQLLVPKDFVHGYAKLEEDCEVL